MDEKPEELNTQAITLAAHGEYPEAIACLKKAIILDKTNYLLWYNLGITYRDAGDTEHAQFALKQAYELNSEDEQVIETLANLYITAGETEQAMLYCMAGLEVNNLNAHMWNSTGVLLFSQGEYQDASEAFEQAVTLDPHYYDALYNLRDTYEQLGNAAGAQECQNKMNSLATEGDNYYA
ncbi:MAG TPA: tetratricopeptide repeat protein [Candidatus Treponema faecavium]|nr:tetratricopeptide repeat protein [Candidatus Treponema faecavium]